jgi:hypothetical protein
MIDAKRTLGDALDAWLRAIADQRSHDEYESRMKLYVRPTFDRTPLVKVTKTASSFVGVHLGRRPGGGTAQTTASGGATLGVPPRRRHRVERRPCDGSVIASGASGPAVPRRAAEQRAARATQPDRPSDGLWGSGRGWPQRECGCPARGLSVAGYRSGSGGVVTPPPG